MPSPSRIAVLLLTLLYTLPLPALGQTTAAFSGRITDATGGVLVGATVIARSLDTGFERTTTSDSGGRYTLALLPPGTYELRMALDGFSPDVYSGLQLSVGETVTINVTLQVARLAEIDTVTAALPAVNTRGGDLSYLVETPSIEQLPLNGRNYTDLAYLQPGVLPYPNRDGGSVVAHGLGMSVNGQDPRANVYLLDGTLLNDMTNGPAGSAAGTALGMDTVEEFRVETNAYSAESAGWPAAR